MKSFSMLKGAVSSLRVLAALYLGGMAGLGIVSVAMAWAGSWPWLKLDIAGWPWAMAPGQTLQIALAALGIALLLYLPSALKVMQLDHAHRTFDMKMEDVARAYHLSHSADRSGAFTLSSEFDAVRERMMYLKDHPDLVGLEPEIIDVAAQMSVVSSDLAEVYSDDKVERARAVLRQRQNEIMDLQDRLARAKKATSELGRWTSQVEIEKGIAEAQIAQLKDDIRDLVPELLEPAKTAKSRKKAIKRKVTEPSVTTMRPMALPTQAKAAE